MEPGSLLFDQLTLGPPLDRGTFYPVESAIDGTDIDELADSAVRVFMVAYAE